MSGEPLRLRVLWWLMVRAERVAGWCRASWLRWHETGGVVLPDATPVDRPGYHAPRLRRSWFVMHPNDVFKCARCGAAAPTGDGAIDSLPATCPACSYAGGEM